MTRLFVAINLDDEIKKTIVSIDDLFSKSSINAKFTSPENMHMTLKFIGEWPFNDVNDVIDILNDVKTSFKPFNVDFEGIGGFPNDHAPRIIWVGGKSRTLVDMAGKIDKNLSTLGIKKENRPFSSHITLARVKNILNRDDIINIIHANKDVAIGSQHVTEFCLKKSELTPNGPIYSDVEVFTL
ncbi:MAG TPA: RNA 2',3'-cyclic phosphodiesterase [Candidatus Methanofastidiosa archaeon]|nr:RNA 2',3'-cyclic phosphodiesterase [Candidatus Methanofastidiosa archaeon]